MSYFSKRSKALTIEESVVPVVKEELHRKDRQPANYLCSKQCKSHLSCARAWAGGGKDKCALLVADLHWIILDVRMPK